MSFADIEDNYHAINNDPDDYSVGLPQKKQGKPQVRKTYTILIMNKPTKLTKKLLKFFINSVDDFNKVGIKFEWLVVYESEMEEYTDQGIDRFPVLLDEKSDKKVFGANKIVDFLLNKMESLEKIPTIKIEENYMDKWTEEIGFLDDDPNKFNEDQDSLDKARDVKMKNMLKNRETRGMSNFAGGISDDDEEQPRQKTKTRKVSSRNKPHQKSNNAYLKNANMKSGQVDDDMLNAFWENQIGGEKDF